MSIARQHAGWLSLVEISGPFLSMPVLLRVFPQGLDIQGADVTRNLRLAYEEWLDNQQSLRPDPAIHHAWLRYVITTLLDLPPARLMEGQAVPPGLSVTLAEHGETLRPDYALIDPDSGNARILIQTLKPGERLNHAAPGVRWKASPITRMIELLRGANVRLGLLTNGEEWMLISAPRGETSGTISWFAELWSDEPVTLYAFTSLLGRSRFFGVASENTLEGMLTQSMVNQQEVTDQLGVQVRLAVGVLVRKLGQIDKDKSGQLLSGVEDKRIYEAALTVMMRLVFLFSAEERGMLMLGDPLYDQFYAVSTMRAQLRVAADQFGEEVLERRHDAWSRLLATFRLVYGGAQHERLRVPAYGGRLFDPDTFPFLEGRPVGTRWEDTPAKPLPIDNRAVLHLLEALQILQIKIPGGGPPEPRRLSFRALDIEQIGHVYEGLLDHTAKRANAPVLGLIGAKDSDGEISLLMLEEAHRKGESAVISILAKCTERDQETIKRALNQEPTLFEPMKLATVCENDQTLLSRVRPYAALLRVDSFGYPLVTLPDNLYVTRGEDRRDTSTHYTPRSLTEPIVQHTLDPIVYQGMADGVPPSPQTLVTPRELLKLKICDMAMGSGAFLVQVCRYLADKLIEGWGQLEEKQAGRLLVTPEGDFSTGDPAEQLLPRDPEERHAFALRIVCDRCIYGVDKNPMAVEMAKLSLWLITLQKDRPFTFLDHTLRSGDSLLGVDLAQLRVWSLDRKQSLETHWFAAVIDRALTIAIDLRRRIEATPVYTKVDADQKATLLERAREAMSLVRRFCCKKLTAVLESPLLFKKEIEGKDDQPGNPI